ncbi:hypothetical protein CVT25_014792 [Psilocybe cyanescens]|uniref:Uncharacterized protein n=1 Tax=Psilocybe cyanescens TaxID=93625 RepID=A0A409X563_PSICY|nr:hypothetical protein CVT25_014792 [Psilocybe cyanescens]
MPDKDNVGHACFECNQKKKKCPLAATSVPHLGYGTIINTEMEKVFAGKELNLDVPVVGGTSKILNSSMHSRKI